MTLATRTVTNYLDEIAAPDGALKANTEIVFQLVDTAKRLPAALFDAVDGKYVTGTQVSVTTDVNGYFTASLWPNTRGEYATCYKVTLPATTFKPVYIRVTEGDGSLSFLAARSNMEEISPQTTSLFDGLLSSITQALGTVTALATSTASGLMPFSDKAKLDAMYVYPPSDVRYYMDGQDGRPMLAKWQADQAIAAPYLAGGGLTPPYTIPPEVVAQLSDLTSTVQAAVDANHGVSGKVYFPSGFFYLAGTVYIQKDTNSGSTGACWKPLHLKGAGCVKANGIGRGGSGATALYRATDGDMFRVNLNSAGAGVTASGATLTNQFLNFKATKFTLRSEPGVHVTGLRGFSTRATLKELSFINMDTGWDFHDLDVNGADNYCDMWDVEDVYFRNMGSHMFRQRNADASVFKNLRCESFQASAVGGFKLWGGRGMQMPGLLVNGLPSTASYIGFIYYASQVVIQGAHFERNYCATALTSPALSASHGFLISGGNGCVISNNEFFNPDGANAVRPFISAYSGEGHQFGGNTFRATRDSSYDVAVFTPYTLVPKNTHQNADGSARTDSVYFDAAVDASYGAVFKNHPLTADNAVVNTLFKAGGLLVSGTSLTTITGSNTELYVQNRSFSTPDLHALTLSSGTASNSSGGFTAAYVKPTINQTGTAGYNALQVNVTEIATGSGGKKLITAGTGGASYAEKFGVDSSGNAVFAGTVAASNLSGSNTGDETAASIKAKLGVSALSGSNTGDQDLSGYASLASPAFTGTPTAPTAAANTNTTQLATTAFVLGQKGTSTPAVTATGGVGVVGTSTLYSPMDHAHPIGDAHTLDGFHASQTGAVNSCVTTNANGHVGLGVAPFGWGPRAVDFVNGGALSCFSTGTMYISVNAYNDNTNWRHKATGAAATAYISALGGFNVLLAPSAAAGATTSLASIISADASGNLIIAGATATKASGTSWANPSDRRLKDEIAQYARGLDVIRQLAVREWVFNGKGGTLAGTRGVGVIADEAEVVIPEIVAEYQGRLDPEGENVALKKVDPSELFWTMLRAIQELDARLDGFDARLTALEPR